MRPDVSTLDIRVAFAEATGYYCREGLSALFSGDAVYPRDGALNGQTSFFRHHGVIRCLIDAWRERALPGPVHVLAAPSSVGCEAYGFSALAHGRLGGAAGYQIDAFDRSPLFTTLARAGAYPYEMYHPMEPRWRDLLFTKATAGGMYPLRAEVAAPVRFLDAQPFETFIPARRYDMAMVNNLFMYMTPRQIADSLQVIAATGAQLVVMTVGRTGDRVTPGALPYAPAAEHPAWRESALTRIKTICDHYSIWARTGPA